jgi:GT2 family glycosyltransferase
MDPVGRIAAVVIGRNEGPRLERCLSSVLGHALPIVFADSGSNDGSAALARGMGVAVVELDRSTPFTAGRGRNEGLAEVLRQDPNVAYVQFVDGDSEMVASWFERARSTLEARPECAVVFGRYRERDPQRSLCTRLYAIAEDPRLGDPNVCGGIAMMRVAAFRQIGGFNPRMLNLEDRELCLRLHKAGWQVQRLDVAMATHEATMAGFGQWWSRRIRGGHARAEQVALHGYLPRQWSRDELRSAWFWAIREFWSGWCWGLILPAVALAGARPTRGLSLSLFAGYAALFSNIYRRLRGLGFSSPDARLYAASCVIAKFPQVVGQLRFYLERAGLVRTG